VFISNLAPYKWKPNTKAWPGGTFTPNYQFSTVFFEIYVKIFNLLSYFVY